jgi:hypothetical protein
MYIVILLHVHITIAVIKTQECICMNDVHVTLNNVINIDSTAMKTQPCVPCIVALHVAAKNMNPIRSS